MLSKVEEMVRVTQNNDIPVAFALVAARVISILKELDISAKPCPENKALR